MRNGMPKRSMRSRAIAVWDRTWNGMSRSGSRSWWRRCAISSRSRHPTLRPTTNVRDVLDTFELAGTMNPESLSAFVVSMAQAPSDVLAVEAFQARSKNRLRAVPLFERIDDLGARCSTRFDRCWRSRSIGRGSTDGKR